MTIVDKNSASIGISTASRDPDLSGITPEPPRWKRMLAFAVLPAVVLMLGLGVGYMKWQDGSARLSQKAAAQAVTAATESTIALLSQRAGSAEQDLTAARDRLTGTFRDDYTTLISDFVVSGTSGIQSSAVATVPAASTISATADRAEVLVFVNLATSVGDDPPTVVAATVRVTVDKVDERWLISQFEPV